MFCMGALLDRLFVAICHLIYIFKITAESQGPMMTSSIGKHFPRYWPFVWGIPRSPVHSPYKAQWRRALMFSLICTWRNSWVNNGDDSDLRCHCAHHDVTVMHCVDRQQDIMYIHEEQIISHIYRTHISMAGIINFISQHSVGCNYLSMPEISASGA